VGLAARIDDFDAQFVAEDARVVEKRLPAGERVEISAADTDAVHADECIAGSQGRLGCVGASRKFPWLIEGDLEHGVRRRSGRGFLGGRG
jgi:hypothetical protein